MKVVNVVWGVRRRVVSLSEHMRLLHALNCIRPDEGNRGSGKPVG